MLLFSKIFYKLTKLSFLTIFLAFIGVIFSGTLIIYFIEPETFGDPFNALWFVMTTATTVGYGDVSPQTNLGKAFTMVFLYVFAIMIVGSLIGKLSEELKRLSKLKEEGKVKITLTGHYGIVGFGKKAISFMEEIGLDDNSFVILGEFSKNPFDHPNVYYVQGDLANEETYLKANIKEVKAVAVFSDESISNSSQADAMNLLIATTIEGIDENIHTIVEVQKRTHINKFEKLKVNELILSNDSISQLFARAAVNNGSSLLFNQLLSEKDDNNYYVITAKPEWKTFGDAYLSLFEKGAILFASDGDLNILKKREHVLSDAHQLYILCDESTYNDITNS